MAYSPIVRSFVRDTMYSLRERVQRRSEEKTRQDCVDIFWKYQTMQLSPPEVLAIQNLGLNHLNRLLTEAGSKWNIEILEYDCTNLSDIRALERELNVTHSGMGPQRAVRVLREWEPLGTDNEVIPVAIAIVVSVIAFFWLGVWSSIVFGIVAFGILDLNMNSIRELLIYEEDQVQSAELIPRVNYPTHMLSLKEKSVEKNSTKEEGPICPISGSVIADRSVLNAASNTE